MDTNVCSQRAIFDFINDNEDEIKNMCYDDNKENIFKTILCNTLSFSLNILYNIKHYISHY